MAKTTIETIRLSAWQFAQHIGKTTNAVKGALKANGIEAGEDDRYTLRDLVRALSSPSGLERRAKEARWQLQIDQAQLARDKEALNRRELIPMSEVKESFLEIQTVLFQIVRHSKLSDGEKQILKRQITELKVEGSQP